MLINLTAEVILANLLRYFPVGARVTSKQIVTFCESIKKQIFCLNKGYSVYAENDSNSLRTIVMNRPSRYEVIMDQYGLKCRVDLKMINVNIPKEVQKILDKTAKKWAKVIGN